MSNWQVRLAWKATKMQNCGIRKGRGHELAVKLSFDGMKVLNHRQIIKYIQYFKTVSSKSMYQIYTS